MNCFNHEAQDAHGVCTHCGKALCKDCINYTQGIVFCQSLCETQAKEEKWNTIFEIDNLLKRYSHKTIVYLLRSALTLLYIGIIAIVILSNQRDTVMPAFFIACIILAVYIQLERTLEKRLRKSLHTIKR